ncbi:MAG: hypothetical protein RLZZ210_598 [Pseudomonadota bacterium]|jgi:hypothetical protein
MVYPVHTVGGSSGGRAASIVRRLQNNEIRNVRAEKSRSFSSPRTSSLSAGHNPNAHTRFSLPVANTNTNTGNNTTEREIPLSIAYSLLSIFSSSPSFNTDELPKLPKSLGNLKTSQPNNLNNRGTTRKSSVNSRTTSSVINGGESTFPFTKVEASRETEETPDDIAQRQFKYNIFSVLDEKLGTNYAQRFTNDKYSHFSSGTMSDMEISSQAVEQAGGLAAYFMQQKLFSELHKKSAQPVLVAA